MLAEARAACDRLVVGLNSDASVRRLKGEGRPIQSEHARAEVLAALEAVDLVVVFEEDTPLELIRRVRPSVLVKGADYRDKTVVGREVVEAAGGAGPARRSGAGPEHLRDHPPLAAAEGALKRCGFGTSLPREAGEGGRRSRPGGGEERRPRIRPHARSLRERPSPFREG